MWLGCRKHVFVLFPWSISVIVLIWWWQRGGRLELVTREAGIVVSFTYISMSVRMAPSVTGLYEDKVPHPLFTCLGLLW